MIYFKDGKLKEETYQRCKIIYLENLFKRILYRDIHYLLNTTFRHIEMTPEIYEFILYVLIDATIGNKIKIDKRSLKRINQMKVRYPIKLTKQSKKFIKDFILSGYLAK